MTLRTQQVRIGKHLSSPLILEAGLPQGGILSPIVFTIYGSDLEMWLKHSKAFTFADDTQTNCKGKTKEEILRLLEEDSENVLNFMASNGLVANPDKTVFMTLNEKNPNPVNEKITVGGSEIPQSKDTKLLGMKVHESQKWTKHIEETILALNRRLYQIRRIKNHLPKNQLTKVIHSLWFSKVRYGIALWARTRYTATEPENTLMKKVQVAQNRLLRMLEGVKIKDRQSVSSMLQKQNFPSINQLAIEVKLVEAWKALKVVKYPTKMELGSESRSTSDRTLRESSTRELKDFSKTTIGEDSFNISAGRLWNKAPIEIKEAINMSTAKRLIKAYSRKMPI